MVALDRYEESSKYYPGWRVVAACFLVELFIFGLGLYGHGIYLAELHRLQGWPTAVISTASTLSLLLGNLLAPFTDDALRWLGPRRLILSGVAALAASMMLLASTVSLWQLFAAYVLLAVAWSGMGTVVVATIIRSWFDQRSGLAISLAFNGATCGGIIVAPALVLLVATIGFSWAMTVMTVAMIAILLPVVMIFIDLRAADEGITRRPAGATEPSSPTPPSISRGTLLRSFGFWTIAAPFALALLAQVGFIVHQIALLESAMGRSLAALAVALTTTMAVIGRLCLGLVVDHLDPRLAATVSIASQAAALLIIALTSDISSLFFACGVYGFSIGNLITFPPLIIHREFDARAFGTVLGLSTAIGGSVSALGPSLLGLVRGATGDYVAALGLCVMLELVAATSVLLRPNGRLFL